MHLFFEKLFFTLFYKMYKHHFRTFVVYTLKKQGSRQEFKLIGAIFYLFSPMGANTKHQYDFLKNRECKCTHPNDTMVKREMKLNSKDLVFTHFLCFHKVKKVGSSGDHYYCYLLFLRARNIEIIRSFGLLHHVVTQQSSMS